METPFKDLFFATTEIPGIPGFSSLSQGNRTWDEHLREKQLTFTCL